MGGSMKRFLFLFSIFIFACLNCASRVADKIDFKQYYRGPIFTFSDIDLEKTPTKDDYPNTDVVCLLREGEFRMNMMLSTFSEHIIVKIIEESGKKYADVKIPFYEDWEILELRARTIKPNGDVVELNQENIFEVSNFEEYVLYADKKAKVFAFPAVGTGCILEYYYTLGYAAPYVPIWSFQDEMPVISARFVYDVPRNVGFKYITSSIPGYTIEKDILDTPFKNKARFILKNLPAINEEPLVSSIFDISSWILMTWASLETYFWGEISSGQESWTSIGQEYHRVLDSLLVPSEEIKEKVNELIVDCQNDEEKIKAIYKYIQNNFRYVAISIEGHRFMPNEPDKVLKNLYGDCKDLASLLITMLKAADITSYPVLIKTKDAGGFIVNFPAHNQINHVMIAIPLKYFEDDAAFQKVAIYGDDDFTSSDDYIIADPTAVTFPLGALHSKVYGQHAVLCAGNDSRLVQLPKDKYSNNASMCNIKISKQQDSYHGTIHLHLHGERAARLKYAIRNSNQEEIQEFILEYLNGYPFKTHLDTFKFIYDDLSDSEIILTIDFTKHGSFQKSGDQLFIPVMLNSIKEFKEVHACHDRQNNIEFPFPCLFNHKVRIVIPEGYKLNSLPSRESLQNEWCEYTLLAFASGDTITINRNVIIKKCLVPKEKFPELKQFAARVLDSNQKIIVFTEK